VCVCVCVCMFVCVTVSYGGGNRDDSDQLLPSSPSSSHPPPSVTTYSLAHATSSTSSSCSSRLRSCLVRALVNIRRCGRTSSSSGAGIGGGASSSGLVLGVYAGGSSSGGSSSREGGGAVNSGSIGGERGGGAASPALQAAPYGSSDAVVILPSPHLASPIHRSQPTRFFNQHQPSMVHANSPTISLIPASHSMTHPALHANQMHDDGIVEVRGPAWSHMVSTSTSSGSLHGGPGSNIPGISFALPPPMHHSMPTAP